MPIYHFLQSAVSTESGLLSSCAHDAQDDNMQKEDRESYCLFLSFQHCYNCCIFQQSYIPAGVRGTVAVLDADPER